MFDDLAEVVPVNLVDHVADALGTFRWLDRVLGIVMAQLTEDQVLRFPEADMSGWRALCPGKVIPHTSLDSLTVH